MKLVKVCLVPGYRYYFTDKLRFDSEEECVLVTAYQVDQDTKKETTVELPVYIVTVPSYKVVTVLEGKNGEPYLLLFNEAEKRTRRLYRSHEAAKTLKQYRANMESRMQHAAFLYSIRAGITEVNQNIGKTTG